MSDPAAELIWKLTNEVASLKAVINGKNADIEFWKASFEKVSAELEALRADCPQCGIQHYPTCPKEDEAAKRYGAVKCAVCSGNYAVGPLADGCPHCRQRHEIQEQANADKLVDGLLSKARTKEWRPLVPTGSKEFGKMYRHVDEWSSPMPGLLDMGED